MISPGYKRLGLLMAAMLLPAMLLHSAPPAPAQSPKRHALAGELLIASPAMTDPRFYQAVVLIVRHDRNGALGIVINRPLEDRSLASLLEALGDKDTAVEGRVRIFAGGPVQPEIGFVLHTADYHVAGTMDIDGRVAVTSSREILRDIANGHGPAKTLIAFGYAGWGPAQLDAELEHRFWFITPEDSRFVFDHDRDKLWDDAMKLRTQDL